MLHPRDARDGRHELLPRVPLRREHAFSFGGNAVVATPALSRLFDPAPLDHAAFLEAIQERIERCGVERQNAGRARFDELAQLVAVSRLCLDERQDEQFGASLFHLAVDHSGMLICGVATYCDTPYELSSESGLSSRQAGFCRVRLAAYVCVQLWVSFRDSTQETREWPRDKRRSMTHATS